MDNDEVRVRIVRACVVAGEHAGTGEIKSLPTALARALICAGRAVTHDDVDQRQPSPDPEEEQQPQPKKRKRQ